MILSIHSNKGCPLSCPPTHLSFSPGLITAHRTELFQSVPFAVDELQIVANPPYGSFMHCPNGLRVRRWLAHECFILVYITVAQLFGSTLNVWLQNNVCSTRPPFTLVMSVSLSYLLCPFIFASPSLFCLISWKYHQQIQTHQHHIVKPSCLPNSLNFFQF